MIFWFFIKYISCVSGFGCLLIPEEKHVNVTFIHRLLQLWGHVQFIVSFFNLLISISYFRFNSTSAERISFNIFHVMQAFYSFTIISYGIYNRLTLHKIQKQYLRHCLNFDGGVKEPCKIYGFYTKMLMLHQLVLYSLALIYGTIAMPTDSIDFWALQCVSAMLPSSILYVFLFEFYIILYEEKMRFSIELFKQIGVNDLQLKHVYYHVSAIRKFIQKVFSFFGPFIGLTLSYYFVGIIVSVYAFLDFSSSSNLFLNCCYVLFSSLPFLYFTNRSNGINNLVS